MVARDKGCTRTSYPTDLDQGIPSLSISEVALEIVVQTTEPEFKSNTVQTLPKSVEG